MAISGLITLGVGPKATIEELTLLGLEVGAAPVAAAPRPAKVLEPIPPWIPFEPVVFRRAVRLHNEHQSYMEARGWVREGVRLSMRHLIRAYRSITARVHRSTSVTMIHGLKARANATSYIPSPQGELEEFALLGLGDLTEFVLAPNMVPSRTAVVERPKFTPILTEHPLENRCPGCNKLLAKFKAVEYRWCPRCREEVKC